MQAQFKGASLSRTVKAKASLAQVEVDQPTLVGRSLPACLPPLGTRKEGPIAKERGMHREGTGRGCRTRERGAGPGGWGQKEGVCPGRATARTGREKGAQRPACAQLYK